MIPVAKHSTMGLRNEMSFTRSADQVANAGTKVIRRIRIAELAKRCSQVFELAYISNPRLLLHELDSELIRKSGYGKVLLVSFDKTSMSAIFFLDRGSLTFFLFVST